MSSKKGTNAYFILLSEYLFILVHFVVIIIVKAYSGALQTLYEIPDWSFAASVLWGQTIVKLVAGGSAGTVIWQRVTILISGIVVLGLIPSLVTLTIMLIAENPPVFHVYLQLTLFTMSSIIYLLVGSVGQVLLDNSPEN
ncbi:MAG TPA: hypothetical protein ENK73_01200 [Thiomicrospira sp.]|nr:hypothetical protein [Thiomicrospira sp.]